MHPPTASFKPPTAPERGCDYRTSHKSTAHRCVFETQRPALCALPTPFHGDTGNGPGGTLCRWKRTPGTACRSGRGTNSVCIWGPGPLGLVIGVGHYVCSVLGRAGSSLRKGWEPQAEGPLLQSSHWDHPGPPQPAEPGAVRGCAGRAAPMALGAVELQQQPLPSLDKCLTAPASGWH